MAVRSRRNPKALEARISIVMTEQTPNPWKTLRTELKFENPWIRVVWNDVINPNGGQGEYTVVHFRNRAVSVVPVDADEHTWLVGQYRYATDSYEWEIPAGGAPEGETTLDCARRELREETGLIADSWELLYSDLQLSNSVTDERACSYLARDLRQVETSPDETEDLQLRRLPLREAIDMAICGEIRDAFSVVSLLRLHGKMLRGEIR